MLYYIHYWWFFLSQGNQWTKYLVHPKIWRPKPCLLVFASLVTLNGFHLLLSTQLTADLTTEWSSETMFNSLSHIYTKTPFCSIETVANNTLNRQHVLFNWLCGNVAPTLNTAFSLTNVHAKLWIHYLLISLTPLLSYTTSIYDRPKRVCAIFWCSRTTAEFGQPEHSDSFVCTTTFKVSIPPLNCCFWWSRVWITVIKPLLYLKSNFSHQKAMFYRHRKFRFFHCFENFRQ